MPEMMGFSFPLIFPKWAVPERGFPWMEWGDFVKEQGR